MLLLVSPVQLNCAGQAHLGSLLKYFGRELTCGSVRPIGKLTDLASAVLALASTAAKFNGGVRLLRGWSVGNVAASEQVDIAVNSEHLGDERETIQRRLANTANAG